MGESCSHRAAAGICPTWRVGTAQQDSAALSFSGKHKQLASEHCTKYYMIPIIL